MRQHHKQRTQQQFVSDRIQILPQRRLLAQPTRQQPIERIADSGKNKQRKRYLVVAVQNLDHKEGNNEQPHQGKQVGGGAELGQKRHWEGHIIVTQLPWVAPASPSI